MIEQSSEALGPIVDLIERAHQRSVIGLADEASKVVASLGQLPEPTRQLLIALLCAILERSRAKKAAAFERRSARLREQIEAAESDATPQAEVNAAVRRMFHDAGLN